MATVFHTQDPAAVTALHDYLALARKRFTQAEIAKYLKVDQRTVQRWCARQDQPRHALTAGHVERDRYVRGFRSARRK